MPVNPGKVFLISLLIILSVGSVIGTGIFFLLSLEPGKFLPPYFLYLGIGTLVLLLFLSLKVAFFKNNFLFIIIAVFILLTILPIPRPAVPFEENIHESEIPQAFGFGWPNGIYNYYLGDGDLCPNCVQKKPIQRNTFQLSKDNFVLDAIVWVTLLPLVVGRTLMIKKGKK